MQPGTSQDVKPFAQPPYTSGKSGASVTAAELPPGGLQTPSGLPWEGRAIATHKLRLVEFSAFMEHQRDPDTVSSGASLDSDTQVQIWLGFFFFFGLLIFVLNFFLQFHKHLFVHIGGCTSYTDPLLEAVDVRQIYDKFPEKKGGLKELYDKGPQSAFFLVKFWADLNTNIQDEAAAFYGVTSQ